MARATCPKCRKSVGVTGDAEHRRLMYHCVRRRGPVCDGTNAPVSKFTGDPPGKPGPRSFGGSMDRRNSSTVTRG